MLQIDKGLSMDDVDLKEYQLLYEVFEAARLYTLSLHVESESHMVPNYLLSLENAITDVRLYRAGGRKSEDD